MNLVLDISHYRGPATQFERIDLRELDDRPMPSRPVTRLDKDLARGSVEANENPARPEGEAADNNPDSGGGSTAVATDVAYETTVGCPCCGDRMEAVLTVCWPCYRWARRLTPGTYADPVGGYDCVISAADVARWERLRCERLRRLA